MENQRQQRLEAVNELIQHIVNVDSDRHNPTLGTKVNGELHYGFFHFAPNGLLYFTDSYTKKMFRPTERSNWRGFSEGGTIQHLVMQLAQFIMDGTKGHLNDTKEIWGWAYGNMLKVRSKAFSIGFIETMDYPYSHQGEVLS